MIIFESMKSVILVSMNGIVKPYKSLENVCNKFALNKKTIYNHWNKRGYYEHGGIRIEKQKIL